MLQELILRYLDDIIIVAIVFSAAKILIHVIHKIIENIYEEEPLKNQLKTIISAILYFLALTVSLAHLGLTNWLFPLLTSAGIVGIIIGVSAQAPLSNIIAGVIILADKPFELGDYVSILTVQGTLTGKVLTMGFRSTKLRSFEENIIVIPNSVISTSNIINLSAERKHLRTSVRFKVEKEELRGTLESLKKIGEEFDKEGTPQILVKEILDGVMVELRVLIPSVESRDVIISQINKRYLNL